MEGILTVGGRKEGGSEEEKEEEEEEKEEVGYDRKAEPSPRGEEKKKFLTLAQLAGDSFFFEILV